ncbi:MAG: hypothetical protein AB7P52_05165 [Alphaproteobacteria bacterium]
MSRFNRAQIDLLRHRLKQHREATPDAGRRCISWDKVAGDISNATGYPVSEDDLRNDRDAAEIRLKRFGERLRQFVEGIRTTGKRPSMLSPPALEAVRFFLMEDEYSRCIDPAEWEAQPRDGYISIMVRIPLADVLERGAQALLDRIELDPMALVIGGVADDEGTHEDDGRDDIICPACRRKRA